MLIKPPSSVQWVPRENSRHRSFKTRSDRTSTRRTHSDRIIHVKIQSNNGIESTNDVLLKKKSTRSSNRTDFSFKSTKNSSELLGVFDRNRWNSPVVVRERIKLKPATVKEQKSKEILEDIEILSLRTANERNGNVDLIKEQTSSKPSSSQINSPDLKPESKCRVPCGISSSVCRVLIMALAILLLCGAVIALVISVIKQPKDTTITRSMVSILWTFNNNTNDAYNTYNGVAINSPSYVTGYTGLDSGALSFNGTSSQYVTVDEPVFEFTYRSFTIEIWFYPTVLITGDLGLFGHCKAMETDQCLTMMIRNNRIYCGFYNDDLSSTTNITVNRWYYLVFVYDYSSSTQYLYLNGNLEGSQVSNKYQGENRPMTIGATGTGPSNFFHGLIEQVSITTLVKSASEIFYTATFVCYYSFDIVPYVNTGPWNFTTLSTGLTPAIGTGRINDAVSFTSLNNYFLTNGFSVLGTSDEVYSMALWIKPTSVSGGSIVHVSKCNTNCASNWCMPFIGLTLTGKIVIQSWSSTSGGTLITLTGPTVFANVWTHIAYVYSPTNGLLLYLNGILFQQSSVFSCLGSGSANYIYFGNFPLTVCSQTAGSISATQYYGIIDEFYLLARELTATEINSLANP